MIRHDRSTRAKAKARMEELTCDRGETVRAWEAQAKNRYVLRRRPDRHVARCRCHQLRSGGSARPSPSCSRPRLRSTRCIDDTKMTDREQRVLLGAIQEHNALLDGLLRRTERD